MVELKPAYGRIWSCRCRRRCRRPSRPRPVDREPANDRGTASEPGNQRYLPLMQLDEALDQRQAKSRTAMAARDRPCLEALEHLLLVFRNDPPTGVADPQQHLAPLASRSHPDRRPGIREADRIGKEVRQDLAHPLEIADEAPRILCQFDVEREVAPLDRLGG